MSHIFISYSRKDIDFAKKIVQALAENDLDTWIDWEDIPKGEDWWQQIQGGIEQADAFLFLVSPDSVKSEICNQEIDHAVQNGKRILPIIIHDIPPQKTHPEISKRNWIFCRKEQDDFNRSIDEALDTIHTDFEWLQFHTELLVKALKWQRSDHEKSLLLRGKELDNAESMVGLKTGLEPYLVDLQREYLLHSRQAVNRQRRRITFVSLGVAIAMIGLAIFAIFQWQDAKQKAQIALSRQLAAQAQNTFSGIDSRPRIGVLLAIQSMKMYPSIAAAQILQNNILVIPIAQMSHDDYVKSVAFSPDGKYIVSASNDGTVRVWETTTGTEIARMTHDSYVNSVTYSTDGKYILSASSDCTARVWETTTGTEIARMTHDDSVKSAAFGQGNEYVISVSADNARVWDAATGEEINRMYYDGFEGAVVISPDAKYIASSVGGHIVSVWNISTGKEMFHMTHFASLPIQSVAFSPDSKYVVSGGMDNTARVWDVATGVEIAHMTHVNLPMSDYIYSVAFSPDGKYVVSGSSDATARVWEATTGVEIARIVHDVDVSSVAFSPDGKYVVSGGLDGTARVWDVATGVEIARMAHDDPLNYAAFSPDSKYVISSSGIAIYVWNSTPIREIVRLNHDDDVISVAFSPDGKYIVSGGLDGTARVWDVATGVEIARMAHDDPLNYVAFSPDGKYIVSGGLDGTARVWEATTGVEISRTVHDGEVNSIAFSPDGKYIVSGGLDGTARVWEATTGVEISRTVHDGEVNSVAFSPDGKYVVSGGLDGTARVWETTTGVEIARTIHDGIVSSVAFSPNGKYIVSSNVSDGTAHVWVFSTGAGIFRIAHEGVNFATFSPDGRYIVSSGGITACVWEASVGKKIACMTHIHPVHSVAFSPDSQYVVSGSWDGIAHVWKTDTGTEIAHMTHDDRLQHEAIYYMSKVGVISVAFSQNGKYVVSGGSDGTARVWIYRPSDLIENACSKIARNLTYDEWNQYISDALPYQAICPNLAIETDHQVINRIASPYQITSSYENKFNSYKKFNHLYYSIWVTISYIIAGWITYNDIFLLNNENYSYGNKRLLWKQVALAGEQGYFLMILIGGWLLYNLLLSVAGYVYGISFNVILALVPGGLLPGVTYCHITRKQSGKLGIIKRVIMGSVAGFLSNFLSVFILLLSFLLLFEDGYSILLLALLGSVIVGCIGGILSVVGALTYIFILQKWISKWQISEKTKDIFKYLLIKYLHKRIGNLLNY